MNKIKLALLTSMTFSFSALAGVNDDLSHFFDSLGYSSNISGAGAYQGQTAGYYTGGSIFARNQVRNTQLASIQMPSYRAGCGGIDLFTGGFSFINSDNLVDTLENIGNNAVSFAFLLALESMAPVVESTTVILQDWMQKMNQTNINDCQAAASLVGGMWPKTDVAQKNVCEAIGSSNNMFSDWTAARHGCGTGGQRTDILENAKQDPLYQDAILQNTNIAWNSIKKQDFLAHDQELAELFMALSGTIIVRSGGNDTSPNTVETKSPLVINNNLIKALMYGGTAPVYACDESDRCLYPTSAELTITQEDALGNQVRTMIETIMDKIRTDEALDDTEIGFLESTRIPLYKMLTVDVAYSQGGSILNLVDYSDVIAADIVYQYLAENIESVLVASQQLQIPAEALQQFQSGVQIARHQINEERSQTNQDIQEAMDMVQKTQALEQQLAGLLSSQLAGQIQWANGMR